MKFTREMQRLFNRLHLDANGGSGGGGGTPPNDPPKNDPPAGDPPKTFTQEDLNRIAAAEKKQGIASAYKELGFENPEDAKKAIAAWKLAEEAKKSDLEKAQGETDLEKKARLAAEQKASRLEQKLAVIGLGVDAKNADDVMTLANARVTDSLTFEAALEEVKKVYPTLFGESKPAGGTGRGGQPPRKPDGNAGGESRATRLAKQRGDANKPPQNPFFKN